MKKTVGEEGVINLYKNTIQFMKQTHIHQLSCCHITMPLCIVHKAIHFPEEERQIQAFGFPGNAGIPF